MCTNVRIKFIYFCVIYLQVQVPVVQVAGAGTQVEFPQVWEDKL